MSAAGVVLFRRLRKPSASGDAKLQIQQGEWQCAIVRQDNTNYGFPKGGYDRADGTKGREAALATAIRELREETGVDVEQNQAELLPLTGEVFSSPPVSRFLHIDEINARGNLSVRYF